MASEWHFKEQIELGGLGKKAFRIEWQDGVWTAAAVRVCQRQSGKMRLEGYLGGAGMPGHCRARVHF